MKEEYEVGKGSLEQMGKTINETANGMNELRNLVENAVKNSSKNTTTTTDKNGNMEVTVNVTENSTENRNVNVVVTAETDSSVKQTTEEVKELGNAAEETSKKLGELGETASQTGESTKEVTKEAETTEQALTRMNDAVDKFNKRGTSFASIKSWYAPLSEVRAALDKVTEGVDFTAKSLDGIGKDKQRQIWNLGASFQVLGGNLSEVSEDMAAFWSMLDENKGTLGINIKMDNMKEAFGLLKEIEEKAGSLEGLGQVKNLGKNVNSLLDKKATDTVKNAVNNEANKTINNRKQNPEASIDLSQVVTIEGTDDLVEKIKKELEKAKKEYEQAVQKAFKNPNDRARIDMRKSEYGYKSGNTIQSISYEELKELSNEKMINKYRDILKNALKENGLNTQFVMYKDYDQTSLVQMSAKKYLEALNASIKDINSEYDGKMVIQPIKIEDIIDISENDVREEQQNILALQNTIASLTEQLKEAQRQVKAVISDQKTFNEAFELSFKHYDKNGDGQIEMREYGEFMDDFLTSIHKKKGSFSTIIKNWKKADKNSDGKISKEEFKEEVFKKMKEFTEQQF